MGGCATKPKELKAEATDALAPEPEPAPVLKEEEVGSVSETTKEVVVEGEIVDKDKDIIQDETVDEQGSRRRSLSNLFKENEEPKDSAEVNKTTLEPVKQEEPSVTEKAIDVYETKSPEAEKAENTVEHIATSVVVDAPVKVEIEKANEAPPVTETQKPATVKAETEVANEAAPVSETQQPAPLKAETEVANEAARVTETQKPEKLTEEKITVEEQAVAGTETHDNDEKKEEK